LIEQREWIDEQGWRLVLVHMSHDEKYPPYLQGIHYGYVDSINDPHCELYRSFGLLKGSLWQLLGPAVWWRGFQAFLNGHQAGKLQDDGIQMPGMFLVSDGKIINSHQAAHAGDHADLTSFATASTS
jgi:hypothetical protein